MDLTNKTVWQIAAGNTDRNYAKLSIKWDVVLNGPGNSGAWPNCKPKLIQKKVSSRKITDIERFAEKVKADDVVVLRLGTSTVCGVGIVVGGYEWSDYFGDVDGWSLQHIRRVRWFKNLEIPKEEFDVYSMKLGDTTQELLTKGLVFEWLSSIEVSEQDYVRPLRNLKELSNSYEIDIFKISEYLFDHGVASSSISNLTNQIGELIRIAKWYQRSAEPSEHETVAYLVVPLLRALGWTPQKMAVEWNHVDVALFDQLPRENKNLRVVVEAKKMGRSCLTAMSQANKYAKGKVSCDRLIVTDGLRYGVYVKNLNEVYELFAYLNLTRLQSHYPIYECHGAEEALLAMAPEWKP